MIQRTTGIYEIALYDHTDTVNEIRVFLIPGIPGQRSLLVDAGFDNRESRKTLEESLEKLDIAFGDLDVFLTHKHHDHTGLARFLSEKGARIFMNPEEDRHPYDCLYYNTRSQKSLDEQLRVLRTVGVTQDKTPLLWEDFMKFNEKLSKPEQGALFGGRPYPYTPVKEGQAFRYGRYMFQAVPLRGHTFGQMGLYDKEHSLLFSADQIIDGIVPIVATAYMNEHLLQMYFQCLNTFEGQYKGCMVYPAHKEGFMDASPIIRRIQEAYQEKLDLIRHIVAFSTKPMTTKDIAFQAYGISLLPGRDRGKETAKIKMILTKTFSCLEYLFDMGQCSRSYRDGILYWSR